MEPEETNSVITGKGFKNWSKSILAHDEAKKALREILEKKWKTFIAKLHDDERHHIDTFIKCMKTEDITFLGTERNLSCGHELCLKLLNRLRALNRSTDEIAEIDYDNVPCLPASDPCFQYYWDIAMLFSETDDDLSKSDVIELDISYTLKIMSNCRLFAFDESSHIYENIYKDRYELFHTSENDISDERMHVLLDNIIVLLSNFEDPRLHVCVDVIRIIKQLKEQNFLDKIDVTVYRLLVEKNLETKIKVLEKDKCRVETINLDETLEKTENLLRNVKESIEEEPDEISKLQEENDKLKNRILELEHQQDKQTDEKQKWIHLLEEENEEFLKDMRCIANAAESAKDFLQLMEMLPLVTKEKQNLEHGFEPQSLEVPGTTRVTTNLKTMEAYLHRRFLTRSLNHDHKKSFDCYTILEGCCSRVLQYPLLDLIIPLSRKLVTHKHEEVYMILIRQVDNLKNVFKKDVTDLCERYRCLRSNLDECLSYVHGELEQWRECVENIIDGLQEILRFVQEWIVDPASHQSFANKWETFKRLNKTLADTAKEVKVDYDTYWYHDYY